MKKIVVDMIRIYKVTDRDWMSFKICSTRSLTYHHILKVEDGGKTTINNGALLTKRAHDFLHCIEYNEFKIYSEINDMFRIINNNVQKCSKDELEHIRFLIIKYLNMGYNIPKNLDRDNIRKMILQCSDECKSKNISLIS